MGSQLCWVHVVQCLVANNDEVKLEYSAWLHKNDEVALEYSAWLQNNDKVALEYSGSCKQQRGGIGVQCLEANTDMALEGCEEWCNTYMSPDLYMTLPGAVPIDYVWLALLEASQVLAKVTASQVSRREKGCKPAPHGHYPMQCR